MMFNRRGLGIGDMAPLAIAMVFVAVVLGIGATILGDVQDDYVTGAAGCNATVTTGCGYAFNATQNGLEATDTFSGWLPTVALVTAAAIVISVLSFFRSFYYYYSRKKKKKKRKYYIVTKPRKEDVQQNNKRPELRKHNR